MSGPLLVFGAGGQLGRTVLEMAGQKSLGAIGLARDEVDILDEATVSKTIRELKPRLILNAAAYTAVDKAESHAAEARAGNVTGPHILALAANAQGIPLIHISTDYVFDGTGTRPLLEDDPIAPIGIYGKTKADGEICVREACPEHFILRTAWVYSFHGNNFLKTMLRLAKERDELRVVSDQIGNPTATDDLAEAIFAIDSYLSAGPSKPETFGTYHFAGTGITSWYGFASAIIMAAASFSGRRPRVLPITSAEFPTPVRRPAYSALDSALFQRIFGYRSSPWEDRMLEIVTRLLKTE